MRKLHLLFRNADGSRKQLVIEHCHQDLSPESVRQAMEALVELAIFEREGVQLYTEIVGAKYVEKRVTYLFDDSQWPPRQIALASPAIDRTEKETAIAPVVEVVKQPLTEKLSQHSQSSYHTGLFDLPAVASKLHQKGLFSQLAVVGKAGLNLLLLSVSKSNICLNTFKWRTKPVLLE